MKKWWRRIRRLLKLSILLGIIWLILGIGNLFHLPNWWPSWLGFGQNHSELMKGEGEKENQASNTPILEKELKAERTSSPNRTKPTEITTPNETTKPVQKLPTIVPAMESITKITAKPTVVPTAKVTMEPTAVPIAKMTAEPTIMPTTNVTMEPTLTPTVKTTAEPTIVPTTKVTMVPTVKITAEPTIEPIAKPTVEVTNQPVELFIVEASDRPINTPKQPFNEKEFPLEGGAPEVSVEPRTTQIPLATIEPTPEVPSKIRQFYFTENIFDVIRNEEECKENGFEISKQRNELRIEVEGEKTILIEMQLTKEMLYQLLESKVMIMRVPFASINLNDVRIQLEETKADQVEFKWNIENKEYHLRANLSNQNIIANWFFNLGGKRSMLIK